MQQFLATLATGDVERLASMLAHDVVAWSDGGGKRAAARKPIRGRCVSRGSWRASGGRPRDTSRSTSCASTARGLVVYLGARPYTVVTFDVAGGRIAAVRTVVNSEKLRHLPSLQ